MKMIMRETVMHYLPFKHGEKKEGWKIIQLNNRIMEIKKM